MKWMLLLIFVGCACCIEIPPEWQSYILTIVASRDGQRQTVGCPTVIAPPSSYSILESSQVQMSVSASDMNSYILPYLLIWDPIHQFPAHFRGGLQCIHRDCDSYLTVKHWKCGQTNALQPRVVHEISHTILLVSVVYVCDNGHEVQSTDPGILQKLTVEEHVPFILLHRTGFTRDFIHSILQLFVQGMHLQCIETFIAERRLHLCTSKWVRLCDELQTFCSSSSPIPVPEITCQAFKLQRLPTPSNDILAKCFLVYFQQFKHAYEEKMASLTATKLISFDHTFKVASNIGYVRFDGRWVTQYGSVFFVMNEAGQVLTWQLTCSTSLDEAQPVLDSLSMRFRNQGVTVPLVLVDNCCNVRNKIKKIFGEQTRVGLDLFHATQRISRTLSRFHPLYNDCVRDLKLILRDPKDIGRDRKLQTPSPSRLIANTEEFIRKWGSMECSGKRIVNDKFLKELNSLKIHMNRGCLSNIPPGGGTNRNEALHKTINPHFRQSRIGIALAVALISILLYHHNSKTTGSSTPEPKYLLHPQMPKGSREHQECESFGIIPKKDLRQQYSWISQYVSSSVNIANTADAMEIVSLSDECAALILTEDIYEIIIKASTLNELAQMLKKLSHSSPGFNYKFLPFMSPATALLFPNPEAEPMAHVYSKRLHDLVRGWGLHLIPIAGDGNCFFSSVAYSLIAHHTDIVAVNPNFFNEAQISYSAELGCMSAQLRAIMVQEMKNHSDEYQGFVAETHIEEEAEKFLQDGHFFGELGNCMPLALANALGMPIILLTTMYHHPLIVFNPRRPKTFLPTMVAYNHHGCGHYDAVDYVDTSSISMIPTRQSDVGRHVGCTCGRGDKSVSHHCIVKQAKYTTITRCPCLKEKKPCTIKCSCKNCHNEYGCKPIESKKTQRLRQKHKWQVQIEKNLDFGIQMSEQMQRGTRTVYEFFVLEEIIKYCNEHDIQPSAHNVLIIYNATEEIARGLDITHALSPKVMDDIETFLREHDHIVECFKLLTLTHLSIHLQGANHN